MNNLRDNIITWIERLARETDVPTHILRQGRERLQAFMHEHPRSQRPRATFTALHPLRQRAVAVLAVFLVLILGGGGVAFAARDALPTDTVLYPLKRATEQAHTALVQDVETRIALEISYADRRLQEAEALLDNNLSSATVREQGIRTALAASREHLRVAQNKLAELDSVSMTAKRSVLSAVEASAQDQEMRVQAIARRAPGSLRLSLAAVEAELLETEKQAALRIVQVQPIATVDSATTEDQEATGTVKESADNADAVSVDNNEEPAEGHADVGEPREGPVADQPEESAADDVAVQSEDPAPQNEATTSTAVAVEGTVEFRAESEVSSGQVTASDQGEIPEGYVIKDEYAELYAKARKKTFEAVAKEDVIHELVLELHDIERDQDRDAVLAIDNRFTKTQNDLLAVRNALAQEESYAAYTGAIDVLKRFADLQVDIQSLIDEIQKPDEEPPADDDNAAGSESIDENTEENSTEESGTE